MAKKPSNSHLLDLSKSKASTIGHLRRGAYLQSQYGLAIDELAEMACRDRFKLSQQILKCASWASTGPKPQYRVVLARAYYAMYHATRAVVFYAKGGDDHEQHQELPKHIPDDFPDRARWENELKTARLERNKADYDPYPKTDGAFATSATATLKTAQSYLPIAKRYLIKKGCKL